MNKGLPVREAHRMKNLPILLVLCVSLTASCANMGRSTQVLDPEEVSKENLKDMPYDLTPEYGFKVSASKKVSASRNKILNNVDRQYSAFSECFEIKDNGREAREYLIAVVDGTFECKYHGGKCNGEYDPGAGLIIVSYKAFNRKGILPLLKHEWAHAYGILGSGHENLKTVKNCIRY